MQSNYDNDLTDKNTKLPVWHAVQITPHLPFSPHAKQRQGEDKSSRAGGNKWIENILQRMDKVSGEACVVKYYYADTYAHVHPHSAAHCLQIDTAAKSRGRRMHRMLEKIFHNLLAYQSRGLNDVE